MGQIGILLACLCAGFGLDFSVLPVLAAEPLPPLMKTLMGIVPEGRGWFVDGPLGTTEATPGDVRHLYECPRVIVPSVDDIAGATGRLFAAGKLLPVRRITRFDEKPGTKGLPGFRGIWYETENKEDVGFLVLTPNQNRFLMWARLGYFPALGVDTIQSKIRDWYARSVSDHLASLDYDVPDNIPPRAGERSLPAWMDLYPPEPPAAVTSDDKLRDFLELHGELPLDGCSGIRALIPGDSLTEALIAQAPSMVHFSGADAVLQVSLRDLCQDNQARTMVSPLTRVSFDTLSADSYIYAVDRYGRIRVAVSEQETDVKVPHTVLFPGEPVLSAGRLAIREANGRRSVAEVAAYAEEYACSRYSPGFRAEFADRVNHFALSVGHLLGSLKAIGIPCEDVLIRKF